MAAATGIAPLLHPSTLSSLKGNFPPVSCRIWRGRQEYDVIDLELYPFDTLYTLKQLLFAQLGEEAQYLPRFLFAGIPVEDHEELYYPLDYLWFPAGSHSPTDALTVHHPLYTLAHPDTRFVTREGARSSVTSESRARMLLEDISETLRIDVFPLSTLLRARGQAAPLTEEVWNGQFAPYFPEVNAEEVARTFRPTVADKSYADLLHTFLYHRRQALERIEVLFEEQPASPPIDLTGIRQLRLTWNHHIEGFEGAASLFYRLPVTPQRPFLRLLPTDSTPVTKLHVQGILPIPTLEDPRVLDQWGKETNQTHGYDALMIKYVHRASLGVTQPLYGTIEVLQEGTMRLTVQPPKTVRKLDPVVDFRTFRQTALRVFEGLPQSFDDAKLREASVQFTVRLTMEQRKFTTARLLKRLPFFEPFFTQITPPAEETPLIALRYKAVSQYVTENKVYSYITQKMTQQRVEDRDVSLAEGLQREFQMTHEEALKAVSEWHEREGRLSVVLPEEDEFVDEFHPGIDLYIYSNHPLYTVIVNRVDSYTSYERIYTLLGLLFLNDDTYFESEENEEYRVAEQAVQQEAMLRTSLSKAAQPAAPAVAASLPQSGLQASPNPASWYVKRLIAMDKALFNPTSGSDAGARGYTSQCQSSDNRQPVILTTDQYERMRMVYEDDPIYWIVYPIDEGRDPVEPLGSTLTVTIMRYGSDTDHVFYYFCPEYFCLHDDIMVLPTDFEAVHDRQGHSKPANSCPFCHGGLITHGARTGLKGRTVMRRRRYTGDKFHEYVGFLKRKTSADLFMPCCFLSDSAQRTLRMKDPKYDHLRAAFQQKKLAAQPAQAAIDNHEDKAEQEQEQEQEEQEQAAEVMEETQHLLYRAKETVEYAVLMEKIHREYILEANKTPTAGKFAMAPAAFDTFFHQNSAATLISRTLLHPKLRPNAQGFLRIGVENTYNESLLGALAPILYRTSIAEVKHRMMEVLVPRVFLNAHFGNLVLEFFEPADATAMPITDQELRVWAQTNLQVSLSSHNHYSVLRIYNAYHRFLHFMEDPKQRKDLRHIQPLLAEPGLFTAHGIQLVILNDHGTKPPTIQCPVFGVSMARNKRNDFVFLSRSIRTMGTAQRPYAHYELYVHTSNQPGQGEEVETHETILRWDFASQRLWPEIVKTRINEYLTQCHSRYESIYTAQASDTPVAIIPLSKSLEAPSRPEGIVKDAYNHVVGVTFRARPGSTYLVMLPVLDDGVVTISSAFVQNIYLDREDVRAAPVEDVFRYYQTNLAGLLALYPGYAPVRIIRYRQQVAAIQLQNGLYVPASPAKKEMPPLPQVDVEEFPWGLEERMIGKRGADCGTDPELVRDVASKDLEEAYQQFRMMVSNWMAGTPAVRRDVEAIIFKEGLPEYERRKRAWLYLSTTLLGWFYADPERWESGVDSFLRKDCRVIDKEDACTGTCHWQSGEASESGEGRCLLHVPATHELGGSRTVSTPMMFTRRVVDELVRFPARRRQLMERGISSVIKITEPLRQGDQYVIPESSPSWTAMLRLEWTKQTPEKPRYYEERSGSEEVERPQLLMGEPATEWFGDAPYRIFWLEDGFVTLTAILDLTSEDLKMEDTFGQNQMIQYVRKKGAAMGTIQNGEVYFAKPIGYVSDVLLLVIEGGRVGVVMEEEGKATISVDHMPPPLLKRWAEAGTVMKKTQPVQFLKGEVLRVPLVARKKPLEVMKTIGAPSRATILDRLRLSLKAPSEDEDEDEETGPSPTETASVAASAPLRPMKRSEIPLSAQAPSLSKQVASVPVESQVARTGPSRPMKRSEMPAPPLSAQVSAPLLSAQVSEPMMSQVARTGPSRPMKRSEMPAASAQVSAASAQAPISVPAEPLSPPPSMGTKREANLLVQQAPPRRVPSVAARSNPAL